MNISDLNDIVVFRLKRLLDNEIGSVQRMRRIISSYQREQNIALEDKRKEIEAKVAQADDPEAQGDLMSLNDEVFLNEEAKGLADELSIIALYKQIEITTKKAVAVAYPNITESQLKKLSYIDAMKKTLEDQGIYIETFEAFQAFTELRFINNSIKHEGVVSKELARFEGWTECEALSNLDTAYERLEPECIGYVRQFIHELIAKRT